MSSVERPDATVRRACPICRSPTREIGRKVGSRTGRAFDLRHCPACGFRFVAEPWTDFAGIYDEAYYRGEGSDPSINYTFESAHPETTIRRYEWNGVRTVVDALAPSPAKWLDFGCGTGGMVGFLQAAGRPNVFGFDTGAGAENARAAGLPILRPEELAGHEGSFDVITAIEVIEHIADPVDALRQIRRLLRPGGFLFLTTGNAARAPKHFPSWSYVQPEIHVSYFTPRALTLALEQAGFHALHPARSGGWNQIVRFKILKGLRIQTMTRWEQLLPWPLLARVADLWYGCSAHPIGRRPAQLT